MLNKFYAWVGKHSVYIVFVLLFLSALTTVYNLVDVVRKPTPLDKAKGVQHHLVWDNAGTCYFVKPYSDDVNYLIPVPDCNKK